MTARLGNLPPTRIEKLETFLIERWCNDMRPLCNATLGAQRTQLIDRAGDYLGFRARMFAAPSGAGASLQRLWEMGRFNTARALGDIDAS